MICTVPLNIMNGLELEAADERIHERAIRTKKLEELGIDPRLSTVYSVRVG